jgi:hypothetical protein
MLRFDLLNQSEWINCSNVNQRTAVREAGHAVAIYIENRRKQLPAIYFHIKRHSGNPFFTSLCPEICGGRLIPNLSMIRREYPADRKNAGDAWCCQRAYEADIVNLLAGAVAEARYESISTHSVFDRHALSPEMLQDYGGKSNFDEIFSYLDFFISSPKKRQAKLKVLLDEAGRFVVNPSNWHSISLLANTIYFSGEEIISYDQIIDVVGNKINQSRLQF